MIGLWLAALLAGCTYRVEVEARPAGATLELADGRQIGLPAEVRYSALPFHRRPATVSAPGHRDLEIRTGGFGLGELGLITDPILRPGLFFGPDPRRQVEVLLVPEHGPAGTWTEDQVGVPSPVTPVERDETRELTPERR